MMKEKNYIVATIRPWNIKVYEETICRYPGKWLLVTNPQDLKPKLIDRINPRYIFFPHWNQIVDPETLKMTECICFHETDLPYGRGGSPVQNLIAKGHKETMISALKMTSGLDAGPIYLKRRLSLEGLAEEIFIRASKIISEMILEIITKDLLPKEQEGEPILFHRRTPDQSEISLEAETLQELFDHLRMLDASEYPKAFINYGKFVFELSRPALRNSRIEADVTITRRNIVGG